MLCSPHSGRVFEPQTSSNACGHVYKYLDQKGSVTILACIQSAGVAPELNLTITQGRKHAKRVYHGFETQGRHHQNGFISSHTKIT